MFDIAVNLTSSQFEADAASVVERAHQAGVNGLLLLGSSLQESTAARRLALTLSEGCWATAGVHPHEAKEWNEHSAEALFALAGKERVVAIGECGLDFNRNFSTPEEQEAAFSAQIALAAELSMPLYVHCRDAHERLLKLLKPSLGQIPDVVVHCFTGTQPELQELLSLGFYIGITGWICDERRGLPLRELLPLIPPHRLLFETDAPYLLPRDLQPRPNSYRNEPCYLSHIIKQAAQWRGEDPLWLGQQTEANARDLFQL
ncbi:MAG: 3'-5' ssDNA/RNA exonuclease TatD [Enterobacteriaceae bacterium]